MSDIVSGYATLTVFIHEPRRRSPSQRRPRARSYRDSILLDPRKGRYYVSDKLSVWLKQGPDLSMGKKTHEVMIRAFIAVMMLAVVVLVVLAYQAS